MSALVVCHRSASGGLAVGWELLEDGAHVGIATRVTSAAPLVVTTLAVCTSRRPREGALAMSRVSGETFRLAPARWHRVNGVWATKPALFDARLPLVPLLLTHCPEPIAALLEAL